jgi:hypothetical protein
MPRAVVFGPVKYGGMSIPDVYTRQTQLHAKYLIQQLRWDKTVANDFLVTLSNLQLESGFVTPLLESNIKTVDYIEWEWISSFRQCLNEIDATFWIEQVWTPKLQREGDLSLMEHFLRIDTTPRERKDLAACLKWLRVITIADLADEQGTEIPGGRLTGEWRAEPCFEWPH